VISSPFDPRSRKQPRFRQLRARSPPATNTPSPPPSSPPKNRNGKKSLTTVQGLKKSYDYKKVLKALKKGERARPVVLRARMHASALKTQPPYLHPTALPSWSPNSSRPSPAPKTNTPPTEFCCNGTVVDDPELGQVIQLQGDQRKNVHTFLTAEKLVKKDLIKIHGF
jgi:translation initiation factor 1 (eIF-1/SUI1)